MRKAAMAIFLAALAAFNASAGDDGVESNPEAAGEILFPSGLPSALELAQLLERTGETPLSELTVADLTSVVALATTAAQEEMYVRRAGTLSLVVPGLGHYVTGSRGRAWGFFAADLFVRGTAAVIAYLVLPAPVKFANLNYLQTPVSDIESRWKSLAPGELLPSFAVGVSGEVLSAVVRHYASRDARAVAADMVRSGSADLARQR